MAIAAGLPGLQVTVNVDGEALPEYNFEAEDAFQDPAQIIVTKYIEAPTSAVFDIGTLYKPPFSPSFQLHPDIMMDGNYVQAPYEEWGGKEACQGYRYSKATFIENEVAVTRSFRFSALVTEEENHPMTADQRRDISCIGQIIVYFYLVEGLEEVNPVNISQGVSEEARVVSQRAMKAATARGDIISCHTSRVKTVQNEPFAIFIFYYRSTAALKSLGIIARTPSPSPQHSPSPTPQPMQRDLDSMSKEEMRAELHQLREQQQQGSVRIKREREQEESVETITADEGDNVRFLEGRAAKRARQVPDDNDEVVVLDDD
ncbi:hypothetical protein DE146DRAFT_768052 [Phaeosphaeria sp. MPI-PUGE-AT-0046c]|nr:hypothetical protein DE146DRAFT_768052 [Phaeosphaeria sp. MPI-PUGE-AT-0046c]